MMECICFCWACGKVALVENKKGAMPRCQCGSGDLSVRPISFCKILYKQILEEKKTNGIVEMM